MDYRTQVYAYLDAVRRLQGEALGAFGFGPVECAYRVCAEGRGWRLRDYGDPGAAPVLLIVAAPIKRPYIWDLAPSVSAVRFCLRRGLRVCLLEWTPPSDEDTGAGLDRYADQAIAEAVARVSQRAGGRRPFLAGHSLGGTFAAIYAALAPASVAGLVLLGAPLCFHPGSSRFRDAIVALAPAALSGMGTVPGSLLSQLSVLASPETFVWSRMADAARNLGDPRALAVHARIERWAMDEVALPAKLVEDILNGLYRDDRFCRGTLAMRAQAVGPVDVKVPVLAVVNTHDEVAPPASVLPFVEQMPGPDAHVLDHPGEAGIRLQHLAILAGRQTYAAVWPSIGAWIEARA